MEERYILAGGRGWLDVREEGARVLCRAELEDDRRGLYKAYLLRGERRLLLGTLTPERGKLRLCRTLSLDDLCRRKLWPPTGGAAELAYAAPGCGARPQPPPPAGWTREGRPDRLMGDGLLSRAAAGLRGALLRREETGFQLALPYAPDRAFALTPLFCFAYPDRLAQTDYMIFSFDGQGRPVFPHKAGAAGEPNGADHKKE